MSFCNVNLCITETSRNLALLHMPLVSSFPVLHRLRVSAQSRVAIERKVRNREHCLITRGQQQEKELASAAACLARCAKIISYNFANSRLALYSRTSATAVALATGWLTLKTRKLGGAVSRRGRLRSTSGLVLWLDLRVGESRKSCIHATRRCWRLRAMIPTDAEMASPSQSEIVVDLIQNLSTPNTS